MFSKTWRRVFLPLALAVLCLTPLSAQSTEQVQIDANAATTPFPHFWDEMFGSGRAILTLRESYRNDLCAVKAVTDFKYVRFHAILHDELGVYNEDAHGNPVYNFDVVDQVYDGLLQNGVRPVVEISFMPKKLAFNPEDLHAFWYKQNVSPPLALHRLDRRKLTRRQKRRFQRHTITRPSESPPDPARCVGRPQFSISSAHTRDA